MSDKKPDDIWLYFDNLDVSKVFVMYHGKCKKNQNPEIVIDSIIVTTKLEQNHISWDQDIYKFESWITKPIYDTHQNFQGKIDGMLTYDNFKKKVTITGKHKYKIEDKFTKDI